MVINELLGNCCIHTLKWVECTCQVTFKSFASCNNLCHNFVSLCLGNTWTEWISVAVSSYSDSGWINHSWVFLWKVSIGKTFRFHAWCVHVCWSMTMIFLNNFVEKLVESSVSIVWSGIETNSWVLVLDTWEDHCFERNSSFILHIFVFIPDFLCQIFLQSRFRCISEECWEVLKLFSWFIITTNHLCTISSGSSSSWSSSWLSVSCLSSSSWNWSDSVFLWSASTHCWSYRLKFLN